MAVASTVEGIRGIAPPAPPPGHLPQTFPLGHLSLASLFLLLLLLCSPEHSDTLP